MFGFEWSLLVKIIYGWRGEGGSVYNLNSVPLDVDPRCIFVVQIYYRVFFFNESLSYKQTKKRFILFFFFVWCLGVGLVALFSSCLKLHEVFHQTICSLRVSLPSDGFWVFVFHHYSSQASSVTECKGTLWRPLSVLVGYTYFWFHLLFKALKGKKKTKALHLLVSHFSPPRVLLPNLKHHLWMSGGMRQSLCFCKHTVQSEVYVHLTRCFHNHTHIHKQTHTHTVLQSVSNAFSPPFCVNTVCTLLVWEVAMPFFFFLF